MPLSLRFLVVTEYLLLSIAGEAFVQPLNKRYIFKGKDIILSNDVWRIAIDVEMEPHEEALTIIRGDLLTVEERKKARIYF